MMPHVSRALKVREAADRLGVCPKTIYRLCKERKLTHLRVGRAIRISEASLDEFQSTLWAANPA